MECECKGPTRQVTDTIVEHACKLQNAPGTSYYDGIQRFVKYERVQVNPALTDGVIKYNWFAKWETK